MVITPKGFHPIDLDLNISCSSIIDLSLAIAISAIMNCHLIDCLTS